MTAIRKTEFSNRDFAIGNIKVLPFLFDGNVKKCNFMFDLTKKEMDFLRSKILTSNCGSKLKSNYNKIYYDMIDALLNNCSLNI